MPLLFYLPLIWTGLLEVAQGRNAVPVKVKA